MSKSSTLEARGDSSGPSSGTTATLIVVSIVGTVAILATGAVLFFNYKRERQYQEACKNDPYLTRKEFVRRGKLSRADKLEEEEVQRRHMICKSLATRSSKSLTLYELEAGMELGTSKLQLSLPVSDSSDWAPSNPGGRTAGQFGNGNGKELHPEGVVQLSLPHISRTSSPTSSPILGSARAFDTGQDSTGADQPCHGPPSNLPSLALEPVHIYAGDAAGGPCQLQRHVRRLP